ncbi:DUF2269 family protein [Pseudomonas turukhanskensis]|uniref:DUF2269 domain-containing protein n=1 Tax=Pseudomonas turukhanskensis TaxID=1806536 RepID=A0A9W6K4M4_9PSED|nr:DUF2269 family protein [Pseudomonas turukhanskensis]GLK87409.1 hypothetical protein GCM10017655_04710 [Pseudomonas turukhanskensis]
MEHYLLFKIIHSAVAVLLPLGVIAHIFMLYKAQKRGDMAVLQRKVRRTRLISLPVFAVLAATLPVSGFYLVHVAGWPLSQLWLLLSTVLFIVLFIVGLLLSGRLATWEALGPVAAPQRLQRFALVYGVLILVLLVAIMGLMGAKPA